MLKVILLLENDSSNNHSLYPRQILEYLYLRIGVKGANKPLYLVAESRKYL